MKDLQTILFYSSMAMPRGQYGYYISSHNYTNRFDGTLEKFQGEDRLDCKDLILYQGHYHGGLLPISSQFIRLASAVEKTQHARD